MTDLRQFIGRKYGARRPTRPRGVREDVGDVSIARSSGLDTASVSLPRGITLEDRAARMSEF